MNDQIDSSIPVLTEIIHPPGTEVAESKKVQVPNASPSTSPIPSRPTTPMNLAPQALIRESGNSTPKSAPNTATPESGSEEWALLEQTIRENVLKQVLSRIDFVLEHRVSDSLAEVLQTAVDKLADDIRAGLKQSLEEVITRAVNQELAKMKVNR